MKKIEDLNFGIFKEFHSVLELLFSGCIVYHTADLSSNYYLNIDNKGDIGLKINLMSCIVLPPDDMRGHKSLTIKLRCDYTPDCKPSLANRFFAVTISKRAFNNPECIAALKNLMQSKLPEINRNLEPEQWKARCVVLKKFVKNSGVKKFCINVYHTTLNENGVVTL